MWIDQALHYGQYDPLRWFRPGCSTLDRPEGGRLGGAPPKEGVSWQRVQTEASFESVIGDATIIVPLMIIAALEGQISTNPLRIQLEVAFS